MRTPARISAPRNMHPDRAVRVRTHMDAVEQLRTVAETLHEVAPRVGRHAPEVDDVAEECEALADEIERLRTIDRLRQHS